MDLNWIWYGAIIFTCFFLMIAVMYLTEKTEKLAQKIWDQIFPPLNKPF